MRAGGDLRALLGVVTLQHWASGKIPQRHQGAGKKTAPETNLPCFGFRFFLNNLDIRFLFQAIFYTSGKQAKYKIELVTKGWCWLKHKDYCSFLKSGWKAFIFSCLTRFQSNKSPNFEENFSSTFSSSHATKQGRTTALFTWKCHPSRFHLGKTQTPSRVTGGSALHMWEPYAHDTV